MRIYRTSKKSDLTPEEQKRYDESLAKWELVMKPRVDAIKRSMRITKKDLDLYIGPMEE